MGLFGKRRGAQDAGGPGAGDPLAPYREAVAGGGPTFESLLWRNKDFQTTRFRVLTGLCGVGGRVVADLGCGRADLLALWRHEGAGERGYVGVEGVAELAAFCRERLEREGFASAWIEEADFAADRRLFDRIQRDHGVEALIFSGSLNTFEPSAALAVLERAWESLLRHAGEGPPRTLAFNFLSDLYEDEPDADLGPARRFDTKGLLDWALARTPRVRFRHDYLDGRDATIAMDTPPTA